MFNRWYQIIPHAIPATFQSFTRCELNSTRNSILRCGATSIQKPRDRQVGRVKIHKTAALAGLFIVGIQCNLRCMMMLKFSTNELVLYSTKTTTKVANDNKTGRCRDSRVADVKNIPAKQCTALQDLTCPFARDRTLVAVRRYVRERCTRTGPMTGFPVTAGSGREVTP